MTQIINIDGKTRATRNTTQDADRLHEGGGFSWTQQNLKHHELTTSVAPPTGKASFERKGFGITATDLIYNISNGNGEPIITVYGNRDVDVQGNLYSMGGGNNATNQAIGKGAFISNLNAVQMLVDGVDAGRLITSGSNSVISGFGAVSQATNIVTSALVGATIAQNVTGTISGAVGMGNAVFRNATSLLRVLGLGSSVMQTAGGAFTDVVGLGHSSFRATNVAITNATNIGSGGQELTQTSGNTSGGYKGLAVNTIGVNNAVFGTLAGSGQTSASNVNILGCNTPNTGNFSNIILLGNSATATANGQLVVGSTGSPIATFVTNADAPIVGYIPIIHNGVARKLAIIA